MTTDSGTTHRLLSSLILLVSIILIPKSEATKHTFRTTHDPRFYIGPIGQPYGFLEKGHYELKVFDFSITEKKRKKKTKKWKLSWGAKDKYAEGSTDPMASFEGGFLLKRFDSENDFARFSEEIYDDPAICSYESFRNPMAWNDDDKWFENDDDEVDYTNEDRLTVDPISQIGKVPVDGIFISMKNPSTWNKSSETPTVSHEFTVSEQGLYVLLYQVCAIGSAALFADIRSTFSLNISLRNYDKFGKVSYLTAGEMPLPGIYLYFSFSYFLCLILWTKYIKESLTKSKDGKASGIIVNQIHHMMTLLVFLKMLSVFFESIRFHYIRVSGHAELWSVVYYFFTFLKSISLFTVILLIGSGWSFVKPFLHDREKKIIFLVLLLQVLDNLALVILSSETEGERPYEDWSAILHLVDILCCCAVLIPIVWQVNALEQTLEEEGEVEDTRENARMAKKLKLFRSFYLLVVAYIYFTRVVVFLFATVLDYRHTYLRYAVTELGTLAFYVVVGFKFRPAAENPYLEVATSKRSGDDGLQMKELRADEEEQ